MSKDNYEEEAKRGNLADDFEDLDLGNDDDDDLFGDGGNGGECNAEDSEFDRIVGELQDIVISEEYEVLSQKFFRNNCEVFEEDPDQEGMHENKMEYMIIFKNYEKTIEKYIESELEKRIEGFSMKRFLDLLHERPGQIDEQLMDTLLSFGEFESFKQLMVDYKKQYIEEQRIEKLKTIKSQRKNASKPLNQPSANIFSTGGAKSSNDPLASLKSFAQKDMSSLNKPKGGSSKDMIEDDEEDLHPNFFIDCRQLKTPKIQNKKK